MPNCCHFDYKNLIACDIISFQLIRNNYLMQIINRFMFIRLFPKKQKICHISFINHRYMPPIQ